MLKETILNALRFSRRPVLVRDLVHTHQDERRREGDRWARQADPLHLGMFPAGRKILVQHMGPSKFKPHVAEREVLDELRRMVRAGEIRLEVCGQETSFEGRPIPYSAHVMQNVREEVAK